MVPAVREKFGLVHSNPYPTDEANHFCKKIKPFQEVSSFQVWFPLVDKKPLSSEKCFIRAVARFWAICLQEGPARKAEVSFTWCHGCGPPCGVHPCLSMITLGSADTVQRGNVVPRPSRWTRPGTDEPSAHPWHHVSDSCCTKGWHFQVTAGIYPANAGLGPGSEPAPDQVRGDGLVPTNRAKKYEDCSKMLLMSYVLKTI
jgi:hypothetical protein